MSFVIYMPILLIIPEMQSVASVFTHTPLRLSGFCQSKLNYEAQNYLDQGRPKFFGQPPKPMMRAGWQAAV
jgi:hypothetical protein